jgi:hypothetical protein
VAGEHYVLSELLRQGFIAALAPSGVPNADIVVTDIEGTRLCAIQAKTRSGAGADRGWHMSEKHEALRDERLFYCFVDYSVPEGAKPAVYVVPSAIAAVAITASHAHWLKTPGKKGQAHMDSKVRRLLPDYGKFFGHVANPYPDGWLDRYREAWELLKLAPSNPSEPQPVLTE